MFSDASKMDMILFQLLLYFTPAYSIYKVMIFLFHQHTYIISY